MKYHVRSEDEMIALGAEIARQLPRQAVLLLTGNLGAGKTTLVKGIASALGAASPDEVSSPTYTLIHEYGDPVRVYHVDLYRLDEPRQVATLGLDEIFERDAVTVVEWADKFPQLMPPGAPAVHIEVEGDGRVVSFSYSFLHVARSKDSPGLSQ
jgi:tRNA threonylcarbamoyladenosine biosynthesis protein TsaE